MGFSRWLSVSPRVRQFLQGREASGRYHARRHSRFRQLLGEQLEPRIVQAGDLPPDLIVGRTLSVYSTTAVQNNQLQVTYSVYNQREVDLANVAISTTLQSGVDYLTSSSLPVTHNGQALSWNLGTIPAYGRGSVTLTVGLPSGSTTIIDSGATASGAIDAGTSVANAPPAVLSTQTISPALLAATIDANTSDPLVQEQAAKLRYSPQAIFDFLNDDIGYESYVGSLRGARGTLWSSAGNSLDEASLGVALFRASGIPARYAHGTLSDTNAQAMILSMFPAPTQIVGYHAPGTSVADPAHDPALLAETRDHYWIQIDTGSGFQNADTYGLPGSAIGAALTTVASTFDVVPDNLRHKVHLSLDAETYNQAAGAFNGGNGTTNARVLDRTWNAVELVGRPVTISHFVSDINQGGLAFSSRSLTYTPYFLLGDADDPTASEDEIFSGVAFQELLTNFPLASQILTGLVMNMDLTAPGGVAKHHERALVDRLGHAGRQNGATANLSVDANGQAALSPADAFTLSVLPGKSEPHDPVELQAQVAAHQAYINQYSGVAVESLPADYFDRLQAFMTSATRLLLRQNNSASDAMSDVIAKRALVRAYADSPRLVLASGQLKVGSSVDIPSTVKLEIDLREDSVRVVNSPGQSVAAVMPFHILRGLAATVIEYNALASTVPLAEQANIVNTYNVFLQAEAQGIPIVLLAPSDLPSVASRITAAQDAMTRISEALGEGRAVFVPERPVSLGSAATTSWYEVNMTTGELISVGENGGHNSALEYAILRATVYGFLSGVITFGFGTFVPEYKAKLALALSGFGALNMAAKAITNGGPAAGSALALPLAFIGGFGSAFSLMNFLTGKDPPAEGQFWDIEPFDPPTNLKSITSPLTATAGQALKITPTSSALSTNQNTPASIPFSVVTDLAGDYSIDATAPEGWIVSLASGSVTVTPAPGTQSGTGIVRLVARSLADPNRVARADINVTVTPTVAAVASEVVFDSLLTVPFGGAQLPTAYQTVIRNLGPSADSYTMAFSNVTPGWEVIATKAALTIPAGTTGILGVYLRPTGGTLPVPGTPVTFTTTVTSTTSPALTQTDVVSFPMPSVAATVLLPTPSIINTFPDTTVDGTVSLRNNGNITETVRLSASALPTGITIDGLPQTRTLLPGEVVDVPYTLTVASTVPLLTSASLVLSLDKTPTGATEPSSAEIPVRVVVPGADAIAAASVAARQLGSTDLADRLDTLAVSLTNLVAAPTDAVAQSQTLASLDAVIRFVNADPTLATNYASNLAFSRNQLAAATTTAQVQSALGFLASQLSSLSQTLAEMVLHGFTFSLAANVVTALPGAPARFPILLENTGTESTTFELSVGGSLPFGTTATFNQSIVTLLPGERLDGGPSGATLSLSFADNAIFPTSFFVIAVPQEAPGLTQRTSASVAVRAEFVQVATVTPSPAFTEPGGSVAINARILNVVNREQAALVSYRVTDTSGATIFTSAAQPVTLGVQSSLLDVALPAFDTTGLSRSDYTIIVSVADAAGVPLPGGSGQAALLVGTPVSATLTVSPESLLSVDSTVTNMLRIDARAALANPLTLLGQTTTTPTATTILIRGNLAYVAGTNGIDIVDVADPAAPQVVGTFGQGQIVNGGFTVVRDLSGERIIVATTASLNASNFKLLTYSVANPTAPVLLGQSIIAEQFISDLFIAGDRALATTTGILFVTGNVISQFGDVLALDLANPAAVAVTDELFGDAADNFNQSGGELIDATTLYVASTTSTGGFSSTQQGTGVVRVIDYSNPASLSQVRDVTIPGTVHALEIAIDGDRALVVGSTGGWKSPFLGVGDAQLTGRMTLTLLDIADRRNPIVLGTTLVTESFNRPVDTADGGAKLSTLALGSGRFAISRGYVDGKPVLLLADTTGDQIAVAAIEVPSLVNEMAVVNDTLYTTSQAGLLIYNVGPIDSTPVTISVQVPNTNTFPNINRVRVNSFNIAPDQIIPGTGVDTLVWHRPLAFGVTSSLLTWQTDVSGLVPGESRDVTLGTDVAFVRGGTPGSLELPATSVVARNAVAISPVAQTVAPGAPATYTVTLANPTNSFFHFTLSTSGVPASWVELERDVFVNAQSTATFTLRITAPAGAPLGASDFVVFASGGGAVQGTAQATLTLAGTPIPPDTAAHGIVAAITPATAIAGQGTAAAYVVRLTNTGSKTETFALTSVLPADVSATFESTSVTVPAGTNNYREVTLYLTPTVGTASGQYPFTVTATSTTSSATQSATSEVQVIANGVRVVLNAATGTPGGTLQMTVTNTGTVADTFDLVVAGPAGLVATLASSSVALAPGDSQAVAINVGALGFALPGTLELVAAATSRANSAVRHADTAQISIVGRRAMEARFDDDNVQRAGPGATPLLLLIENTGNLEDAYSATIDQITGLASAALIGSDGLAAQSVPLSRLAGLATGAILVDAQMLAIGTATVRVRVQSLIDPTLVRFATATLQATNTNAAPTDLVLSRSAIFRDQPAAWVSEIRVLDPDVGQSHTFTFSDTRFVVVGGSLFLKPGASITAADGAAINLSITATDNGAPAMSFTKNVVLAIVASPGFVCPYQWKPNIYDVDANGVVAPLDVSLIINELNAGGPRTLPALPAGTAPPPFYDVSCDGLLSPLDAAMVINQLNSDGSGESTETPVSAEPELTWAAIDNRFSSVEIGAAAVDDIVQSFEDPLPYWLARSVESGVSQPAMFYGVGVRDEKSNCRFNVERTRTNRGLDDFWEQFERACALQSKTKAWG